MTEDQLGPIRARVALNRGFKSHHPDVDLALRDREALLEEVDRLRKGTEQCCGTDHAIPPTNGDSAQEDRHLETTNHTTRNHK
jgi:hypothetical protein